VFNDAYKTAKNDLWYGDIMYDLKGVAYENHYTSFYCVLTDAKEFIYSLNKVDYEWEILSDEDSKLLLATYAAYENLYKLNWEEYKYECLYEWIEKQCVYLLGKVEEFLHNFESDDYIKTVIESESFYYRYEKYYVLDNDFSKVYYDYTKQY
jgi:hypothetical protein